MYVLSLTKVQFKNWPKPSSSVYPESQTENQLRTRTTESSGQTKPELNRTHQQNSGLVFESFVSEKVIFWVLCLRFWDLISSMLSFKIFGRSLRIELNKTHYSKFSQSDCI